MSRDPLGLWGDPGQVGNGQSYCGNNPVNRVDPMGDQDQGSDTDTNRIIELERKMALGTATPEEIEEHARLLKAKHGASQKVRETFHDTFGTGQAFEEDPQRVSDDVEGEQAEETPLEDPLAPPPPPLTPSEKADLERQRLDDIRRKAERGAREARERLERIRSRRSGPRQPRHRAEDASEQERKRRERELRQVRDMVLKRLREMAGMCDRLWPDRLRDCPVSPLPTNPNELGETTRERPRVPSQGTE